MLEILTNKGVLHKLEPLLLPLIVVLVGLTSFGLGRLSAGGGAGAPRLIINAPLAPAVSQTASAASAQQGGAYVASKSGSKYYLTGCSGANRIKEENKVYFDSVDQAKAAGYEPAANCPGL